MGVKAGHLQGPRVCRQEHELFVVVLLFVDAVHHEVLVETCPLDIMSVTTNKMFERKKQLVDIIIFTEIKANKKGVHENNPSNFYFVRGFKKHACGSGY